MPQTSKTSQRQEPQASIEEPAPHGGSAQPAPARSRQWVAVSEMRERPGTGQRMIFVMNWAVRVDDADPSAEQAVRADDESAPAAEPSPALLPPLHLLRTVTTRWMRLVGEDAQGQPMLVAFRVAGTLSPDEVEQWCPGATVRLYTLAGPVAPLPDGALAMEPLARYSVVRAPNMSFWPQLRALIEEQERAQPGMELWENLEHDLAALEEELTWWTASPHGLVLNLYEGEELVGHLSLARQRDETEGCDGWGIIALHIAQKARGQHLGALLQRVAATLIANRRAARRAALLPDAEASANAPEADDTRQAESETGSVAAGPAAEPGQETPVPADDVSNWPSLFGFIPAHNLPALRGAYDAGREIIASYVDVPVAALEQPA
jgi:hypothetical protein